MATARAAAGYRLATHVIIGMKLALSGSWWCPSRMARRVARRVRRRDGGRAYAIVRGWRGRLRALDGLEVMDVRFDVDVDPVKAARREHGVKIAFDAAGEGREDTELGASNRGRKAFTPFVFSIYAKLKAS